ncbi:DedA family protein, partial [Streptomyces sp. SID625]|nr:DedA family protein [Streptomyces sp. SID625]
MSPAPMNPSPLLSSPLAVNVLDAQSLLAAFGVLGVGVVMFAETGLLIGFFLPGDSLLFTAGLLCTGTADRGVRLSLLPLLLTAAAGALAGSQCGFVLGRRAGGALLARSR